MPFLASGSGRCLPWQEGLQVAPAKNPASQHHKPNIQESRPAARSVSTRACICFHPGCSSTSQCVVQLGWQTPGPCSSHGVSSAKSSWWSLKPNFFFNHFISQP